MRKLEHGLGKVRADKDSYRVSNTHAGFSGSKHYVSIVDAVTTYRNGGFAGIRISCFGPFNMIDVDNCVDYGVLDAKGQDIVDTFES